ncbi:MAG: winged helix-turn-helix transcriptional regulator [Devosia sp.]
MQHSRAGIRRRTQSEPTSGPRGSGRTPLQIADHNLRVTLEAIRRDGPLTRLELGRRSGLTAPGITNILRRLSADGLVTARKRHEAGGGQPSMEFALNPDGAFSIGVRLHGARSEAVLIDLSGGVRDAVVFDTSREVARPIEAAVKRLLGTAAAPGSVVGIGALRAMLTEGERLILAAGGDLPLTPAVKGWVKSAAGHLLDAIVATAGFLAPGAILIGGDLPRNVVEALIAQMSVERVDTAVRPVLTPWISPMRPASFAGAGIAVGAALLPLFDLLLPSPMAAA